MVDMSTTPGEFFIPKLSKDFEFLNLRAIDGCADKPAINHLEIP